MTKSLTKKSENKTGLHPTRNSIAARNRTGLVQLLNHSLASTFDLYSQVKQAHWNVKGRRFYQLHELFDEIASELLEFTDELAERATALGGTALGTVRMAGRFTTLDEYPANISSGQDHLEALVERFGAYANAIRESIDAATELADADTADLFTEISRTADKRLWFLEAHLHED